MYVRLSCLCLLLTLLSCTTVRPVADSSGAWAAHPLYLQLESDGTYFLDVVNSVDGCLTVKGNGFSAGRWTREGDMIRFVPNEEHSPSILEPGRGRLWVSLAGASAHLVQGRLRLLTTEREPMLLEHVEDTRQRGLFGFFSKRESLGR